MKRMKRPWVCALARDVAGLEGRKVRGLWFTVHTPEHLKVGTVNYWPRSGRIYIDGAAHSLP